MLEDKNNHELIELLHELQSGKSDNIGVKIGPLGQLLKTSAVERVDNLHGHQLESFTFSSYVSSRSG